MYEVYTIKFGDTLEGIASVFNININDLVKFNSIIDLSNLKEGMQIMIPNNNNNNPYRYYTIKKGDNIKEIAKSYNIDYDLLLKLNGLEDNDYVYPNQTIVLPKEGVSLYLTKDNDTINSVADNVGMSVMELINNNENIYLRENQIIVY